MSRSSRLQRRQVEDVAQRLAVGLEHDREVRVAAHGGEQVLRLEPLRPQRRALARAGAGAAAASAPRSRGTARRTARCRASWSVTSSSTSSGSGSSASRSGSSSTSAKRSTMPSSVYITCTSKPLRDRRGCCCSAIAQGACTRAPNGVRMQTRQSPSSSRKRSTVIARSVGRLPVCAFLLGDVGRRDCRAANASSGVCCSQPVDAPRRSPSRAELAHEGAERAPELDRPARAVAAPERQPPGSPGAGETITRSRVIVLDPPGAGAEQ